MYDYGKFNTKSINLYRFSILKYLKRVNNLYQTKSVIQNYVNDTVADI